MALQNNSNYWNYYPSTSSMFGDTNASMGASGYDNLPPELQVALNYYFSFAPQQSNNQFSNSAALWGGSEPQSTDSNNPFAALPTVGTVTTAATQTTTPSPSAPPPQTATIYGDGHILDPDGGQYNFTGTGVFTLLKDDQVNVSGNFTRMQNGRGVLTETSASVGNQNVHIDSTGNISVTNTDPNNESAPVTVADGDTVQLDKNCSISRQGNTITLASPQGSTVFTVNQQGPGGTAYMNVQSTGDANAVANGQYKPQGILGETMDADTQARSFVGNSSYDFTAYQQSAALPGSISVPDPNMGQLGYVESMYLNILGQEPSRDSMKDLSKKIYTDGLGAAYKELYNSDNFKKLNSQQKADALYAGIFQRKPTDQERADMVKQLDAGASTDDMVDKMLSSDEAYQRAAANKMPSPLTNKEAVQTVYDAFGDGYKGSKKREDIQALIDDPNTDAKTRAAARQLLNNDVLFKKLDGAEGKADPDGKIGDEDFDALLNNDQINAYR